MRLGLAVLVLAVTWPLIGMTDPIPVRSGDHSDFTRLVLRVDPETEPRLSSDGKTSRITIDGHSDGFDTSGVFRRISRERLSRIQSTPGLLELFIACDCDVTSFEQGDTFFVVDIRNREFQNTRTPARLPKINNTLGFVGFQPLSYASNTPQTSNAFLSVNSIELPWQNYNLQTALLPPIDASSSPNVLPDRKPIAATDTLDDRVNKAQSSELASQMVSQILPELGSDEFASSGPSPEMRQALRGVQSQLARQVGTAASRGLLEATEQNIELPLLPQRPQVDVQIFDSSITNSSETDQAEGQRENIRITTSADVVSTTSSLSSISVAGFSCDPTSVLDVASWAENGDFAQSVSDGRIALFGEFDRLNLNAAVSLSKTYLHYGFGAEALDVLTLDPKVARENNALIELADIMEYGHVRDPYELHHYSDCKSEMALWGTLALPEIPKDSSPNVAAAVLALSALPVHLRQFLAPELSRRLTKFGDTDGAAAAMRAIERLPDQLPVAGEMARAELELAKGNTRGAQARLSKVVGSNTELSAEALVKFVETQLTEGAPIAPDIAALVEGYATELRDDELGPQLQRAQLIALAKSRQWDKAFAAFAEMDIPEGDRVAIRSELASLLVEEPEDFVFLDHAFGALADAVHDLPSLIRLGFASRLTSLGFPDRAEAVMPAAGAIPKETTLSLLRARIAIKQNRPADALTLLEDIEIPEAADLRAIAADAAGEHDQAFSTFADRGEEASATRSAWLSGDWQDLVSRETPVFGPMVDVAETELEVDPSRDGMLQRSEEVLNESAEARARIEALISLGSDSTGE